MLGIGKPRTMTSNRTVVPSNSSVSFNLTLNFGACGKNDPPGLVGLESSATKRR